MTNRQMLNSYECFRPNKYFRSTTFMQILPATKFYKMLLLIFPLDSINIPPIYYFFLFFFILSDTFSIFSSLSLSSPSPPNAFNHGHVRKTTRTPFSRSYNCTLKLILNRGKMVISTGSIYVLSNDTQHDDFLHDHNFE